MIFLEMEIYNLIWKGKIITILIKLQNFLLMILIGYSGIIIMKMDLMVNY